MKFMRLCFDLDGTICKTKKSDQSYEDVEPIPGMVEFLQQLHNDGHYIIIMTARNMATLNNNLGKIIAIQSPIVINWLQKYNIPYDELIFGKPNADYFIDDKGVKFINTEQLKQELNYV